MSAKIPPPTIHINNTRISQPSPETQAPLRPVVSLDMTAQFGDAWSHLQILPGAKVSAEVLLYGTATTVMALGIHPLTPEQWQQLQPRSDGQESQVHLDVATANFDQPAGLDEPTDLGWLLSISGSVPVYDSLEDSMFEIPLETNMQVPWELLQSLVGQEQQG